MTLPYSPRVERLVLALESGAAVDLTPVDGAPSLDAGCPCPACQKPLWVRGVGPVMGHDTVTSTATCVECRTPVGKMVAHCATLFGLEEDARIFGEGKRWRVYG